MALRRATRRLALQGARPRLALQSARPRLALQSARPRLALQSAWAYLPWVQWRLRKLEQAAQSAPEDAAKQAALLEALNKVEPSRVLAIVQGWPEDRRQLKKDALVGKQYVKAAVLCDRLDELDLADLGGDAKGADGRMRLSLAGEQVNVVVAEPHRKQLWRLLRTTAVVLIVVAGASVIFEGLASNMQKGLGMSKSYEPVKDVATRLADVCGCDEVKREIQEVVIYLQNPERFTRLGAVLPKGILLSGAPGTGKTLLARAIAGEAGVPFIAASGSEFEEMYVGVGARRIREVFAAARAVSPCILFIDEIDAVGSKRNSRDNSAVRMTLNQLLVELDGFQQNEGVVVLCATNYPQSLDKALTRPGRLDRTVVVPTPDLKGRRELLELYGQKVILDDDVDMELLSRRTAGMTGADLSNLINIAAIRAAVDDREAVPMSALEDAFDRVLVGLPRKSPMSEKEQRLTAYHEGGHALIAMRSKGADPVHKATILPRGQTLGVTWSVPAEERYSRSIASFRTNLDVLMGGKVAEELVFGVDEVTAGCSSDLQQATGLARQMVMQFGMGSGGSGAHLSVDREEYGALAEQTRKDIDARTQALLDAAYDRAVALLTQRRGELEKMAEALVEFETLDGEELELATQGRTAEITRLRAEKTAQQQQRERQQQQKREELERRRVELEQEERLRQQRQKDQEREAKERRQREAKDAEAGEADGAGGVSGGAGGGAEEDCRAPRAGPKA